MNQIVPIHNIITGRRLVAAITLSAHSSKQGTDRRSKVDGPVELQGSHQFPQNVRIPDVE